MSSDKSPGNRYACLIERVFLDKYKRGMQEVLFHREDLAKAAATMNVVLPKNVGDVIYSMRYRTALPDAIKRTQPAGKEWIIEGKGKSEYAFRLVVATRIAPNPSMAAIKIPDATPEIVGAYALSDEQALLAKVRYNRLIDIFLGVTAYSLQNHLRTHIKEVGQVEIDEIYVAVDSRGRQYVIPVQAKGGNDRLSGVQTNQDLVCCQKKFPQLICRSVSAQFVSSNLIALFEVTTTNGEIQILEERHYSLVPADQISLEELKIYNR
ncbi:MAG: endonuclease [FCB group bacterium]|jgi:hypothetical protein|nr:endonuclease [FCB group bacterium]